MALKLEIASATEKCVANIVVGLLGIWGMAAAAELRQPPPLLKVLPNHLNVCDVLSLYRCKVKTHREMVLLNSFCETQHIMVLNHHLSE